MVGGYDEEFEEGSEEESEGESDEDVYVDAVETSGYHLNDDNEQVHYEDI